MIAHLSPLLHVGLQLAQVGLGPFARISLLRGLLTLDTQLVYPHAEVFTSGLLVGKLSVGPRIGRLEMFDLRGQTLVLYLEGFQGLDVILELSRVG